LQKVKATSDRTQKSKSGSILGEMVSIAPSAENCGKNMTPSPWCRGLLLLGAGKHEHESAANHKPRDCCTAPGVVATARQLFIGNHRIQPTDLWQ